MTITTGPSRPTAVLRLRQQDAPTPFDCHRHRRPIRLRRLIGWHTGLVPHRGLAQQRRNTALIERLLDVAVDLPIAAGSILGERADLKA